jgi:RNA-directed DNA polymerase
LKAHQNAKRGKSEYGSVKFVEANLTACIDEINLELKNKTYKTSEYSIDTRVERGKKREIHKLPYFKDRIVHHAILQVIEPILSETYIKDTYQSIKGRGVHKAKDRLKTFLQYTENTKYCLKIDIKKYYPSVDNAILKTLIRKKIKCNDTLNLVDEIIDSTKGLPIGNYTSQTFGNYYLSHFDHWIKEDKKVKYYIRYADDMIFMSNDKEYLHELKKEIETYLAENLKLRLKENSQIFPTNIRGIDFLGFRFFHEYTMLRNSIKKAYMKLIKSIQKRGAKLKKINLLMAYYGWIKASDSYNLLRATITKVIIEKFDALYKKLKTNNPLVKLVLIPKRNINNFGNYQPTLF